MGVPLVPFLAFGSVVALFFGDAILAAPSGSSEPASSRSQHLPVTRSRWLESGKRRGFPRLFDGSGSRFVYVQVALFLYEELEGPGPETLHVLPLTVSVMQ